LDETNTGQSFLLVDGLTEDHTTSGVRIKSNVTERSVHDLVYRNICMSGVKNPIASVRTIRSDDGAVRRSEVYGDRIPI